ncbi:MAG: SGNH/GDSL hydrolase family protein [Polyangiaceae bacterium]
MSSEAARQRLKRALKKAGKVLLWLLVVFTVSEVGLRVFIAMTDVEHGLYRADQDAGWLTKPNLKKRIDLKKPALHFTADTNSVGLRGSTEVGPKAANETRVLVLGDSFTWGIGVESTETFPVLLEERLRARLEHPVSVVNGGMPNYGTVQELGFYRAYGKSFSPDVVVLAYYINDDGDNATRFVYADGFLWQDPVLFAGHPSFVVELGKRLGIMAKRVGGSSGFAPDGHAKSLELIAELAADCRDSGIPFLVLQIPPRETTRFVARNERPSDYQPLEIPPEQRIEFFDAVQASESSPYLEEHHLDPRGHALAAAALDAELAARVPALSSPPRQRP